MRMLNLFKSLIGKANKIVISTHVHPDADGIGSQIALCIGLRALGKEAICVNEEVLMKRYKYLDSDDVVISYDEYQDKYKDNDIDLFIVADTNSLSRVGRKVELMVKKAKNLLFIDHHPCAKELAAIHCIDTSMAATGELVGSLLKGLNVELTEKISLALYTSILIDTSSFRYPTVTGNTHRLLGDLLDSGIKPPNAYNYIYGTKKVKYLQLLGTILSKAKNTPDEKIGWIAFNEKDLGSFDVEVEDTHAFINHLLILNNIKVACMFRQDGEFVKISFRSAGDIDVGVIAQALGGGGHNHSAATIVEGKLTQVVKETVVKLQIMLD